LTDSSTFGFMYSEKELETVNCMTKIILHKHDGVCIFFKAIPFILNMIE
jgi:hypothetical protein